MTIGIDRPEVLAENVAEASEFKVLKIKVGTDRDEETLRAVRQLVPHQRIRVDANCGWSPDDLPGRIEAIAAFDLELIEQPTRAGCLDAVRAARGASPVPLIADEDSITVDDVPKLEGIYDGINVKLSKCGGIREARRMIDEARRRKLEVMLGCMVETSIGVAAAAHIASLADYVDLDGHLLLADDPFCGLELRDGVVLPGNAPGLGVQPRSVG
jgi:L-alanine-DL-glutamate epimerase-like enolase superfamily enzyme